MHLDDYDYALPQELIAQYPPAKRGDARMLALRASADDPQLAGITDLPSYLRPGDLMVLNDTRVIPARLFGTKETGGAIEILIERVIDDRTALAHVRASKAPKPGSRCFLQPAGEIAIKAREGELFVLETANGQAIDQVLTNCGHMPLPPYIERADQPLDSERYQTVFATQPGAVAAPTAGLHLDHNMLDAIGGAGVDIETLTLHVGAGTFRPVRGDSIDDHVMHAERIEVSERLCAAVAATRARGGRVVAIGTTVARALEAVAARGLPLTPYCGDTQLFIRQGFEFQVIDALLTNFHLPRSTLLMLVCAFAGHARVMQAYRTAVMHQFRFFSYGDAMWLERPVPGIAA